MEIKENKFKREIDNLVSGVNKEKIDCNSCPLKGDATECFSCTYGMDYTYLSGDCINRNQSISRWKKLKCLEPTFSGTNNEIKSIPLAGWTSDNFQDEKSEVIAVIWSDLSKCNIRGVEYKNDFVKEDDWALSCILDILRTIEK